VPTAPTAKLADFQRYFLRDFMIVEKGIMSTISVALGNAESFLHRYLQSALVKTNSRDIEPLVYLEIN